MFLNQIHTVFEGKCFYCVVHRPLSNCFFNSETKKKKKFDEKRWMVIDSIGVCARYGSHGMYVFERYVGTHAVHYRIREEFATFSTVKMLFSPSSTVPEKTTNFILSAVLHVFLETTMLSTYTNNNYRLSTSTASSFVTPSDLDQLTAQNTKSVTLNSINRIFQKNLNTFIKHCD